MSAVEDWTPDEAEVIARACGIPQLGERHWLAITTCRELQACNRTIPTLIEICETSDLTPSELSKLFYQAERHLPEIAGVRPFERSSS